MPKAFGLGATGAAGGGMPAPRPQPFGSRGSQERYDLTMQMISQAMNTAQGSTNPLVALLTPLASAAIGARATKLREDEKAKNVTAMTETMLGPNGLSPRAQAALDVMNNPDAPDYLQSIASAMLKDEMKPVTASGGGRRRSAGGGSRETPAAARKRIYGEYEVDGYIYGRDGSGTLVPYLDPNGNKVPVKGSRPPPATSAPQLPPDPVIPAMPPTPTNDPLGIR